MKQGKNRQSSRPILSICMIVKNEEENLERCLKSLCPLMEGVSSELIITDTGSSDRTVEIAKRYTNQVLFFEWCDDFAAARNTGLDVAKGEWVMAIDADEELADDLSELIHFFNSELRHQYVRASGIMKNSVDVFNRDAITNEQNVNHFFRMDTHPRYEGRIHESVELLSPYYQFGFMGYHYGYAYKNEEERLDKMKRNMKLIRKELEEKPDDMRILLSAVESVYDQEERKMLLERLEKAVVKAENPIWMIAGYKRLSQEYMELKQWEDVVKIVDGYKNSRVANYSGLEIVTLDIWYAMTTALFNLSKNEEGIVYADQYLEIYHGYEDGKLDRTVLMYISIDSYYDLRYNKIILLKTEMFYHLKKYQEAAKELQKLRKNKLDAQQLEETFNLMFILMQQEDVELPAGEFYQTVKEMKARGGGWEKAADYIYLAIETRLSRCAKRNQIKIAKLFLRGASTYQDDFEKIIELMSEEENEQWQMKLSSYVKEIHNWERALPELYYMAMKAEIELPKQAFQIKIARMQVISGYILTAHQDEILVLTKAILSMTGRNIENIPKLSFGGDLLEKAIRLVDKKIVGNEWSEDEKKAIKKRLLRGYSTVMKSLLAAIYRPEVLVSENMELLPVFHQRGYWINNAYIAMDEQLFDKYERCLKGLVIADKSMKDIAEWLVDEYEDKKSSSQKVRTEFEELAKSVKESVKVLAEKGQIQQAIQVLLQLKKLCPEDAEIDKMIKELTEV